MEEKVGGESVQGRSEWCFLLVPFQCDICWFINLQQKEPDLRSLSDLRILGYIRRVNLDVIWSRSPGTIANTKNGIVNLIECWKDLGLEISLPKVGPWPVGDHIGFNVALAQLRYSQRGGQNRTTHLQFDSVRKLRTAYAHLHQVGRLSNNPDATNFKSLKGEVLNHHLKERRIPSNDRLKKTRASTFVRGKFCHNLYGYI